MSVNRRARALLLVTTLLLGVLPASPLLGLVAGLDELCSIHGRDCTCLMACRRGSGPHTHDSGEPEKPTESSPGQKPSCHGAAAEDPAVNTVPAKAPSSACFMRNCGDSSQPLAFNAQQPFLPVDLALQPLPVPGLESDQPEPEFRLLQRNPSPPTPPPKAS